MPTKEGESGSAGETEEVSMVDVAYTALWNRNATRMKFMTYKRWGPMLKYYLPQLDNRQRRHVFQKLVRAGYFIARKINPTGHQSYLFTQVSTSQLTEEQIEERVKEATAFTTTIKW